MRVSGMQETRLFHPVGRDRGVATVLHEVHRVLKEKGYDPVSQIVGYLLSGDPSYITREVRGLLRTVDRDLIIV